MGAKYFRGTSEEDFLPNFPTFSYDQFSNLPSRILYNHTPVSVFPSVGMKISIEIPMGIEDISFPTQKFQLGWFWSAIFSIQFPMEIKSKDNFPVGLKF